MHQDEIIRRLAAGEGFGGRVPDRLDTHISTIFLVGDEAYKLKRAITTSYLDYGSLAARRRFCEAEIEINRRTAPGIYLGAVPVTVGEAGSLIVGDDRSEPVEWLVHMRRFSQDTLFDRMAEEGRLSEALLIDLADEVARFHAAAETVPDDEAARRTAFVVEENAEELHNRQPDILDAGSVARFDEGCRAAFADAEAVLSRRGAEGRVRRCHGDLHLRNICLFEERPTLFDAIEFSDTISDIDVLFDIAFLLMDLIHRGLRREANAVFNRYLYRTGDSADLDVLPLFLALRAGIRAHTSAMAAASADGEDAAEQARGHAQSYLRLGIELLDVSAPVAIAVGGMSGTGKSTVARALAPYAASPPGALVLSTDPIRKQLCGVEPLVRLPPEAYTRDMDRKVYDTMLARASSALAAGRSVILDGTFRDPATRKQAEAMAAAAGVPFDGVWLYADEESLTRRVTGRTGDASDATLSILRQQLSSPADDVEWRLVDAGRPLDEVSRDTGRMSGISAG